MKEKAFALLAKVLSYGPIKRAVVRYAKRTKYYHIPEDGSYMERYWIIREGSTLALRLGHSVRLHIIKSPDQDRAMHTHPFTFRTMIIEGGYTELRKTSHEMSDGVWTFEYDRKAGESYVLDKDTPHQIVSLTDDKPATTIFIYDERAGDWFFDTDEGLVPHAKYLNEQGA
jgi:hypothetical protein